jgi:hypothetical protein
MPGLVPGIHALRPRVKAWMAGTSPAMTKHSHGGAPAGGLQFSHASEGDGAPKGAKFFSRAARRDANPCTRTRNAFRRSIAAS